jgi:uncharacterized membrane protein (DUF4010 family)
LLLYWLIRLCGAIRPGENRHQGTEDSTPPGSGMAKLLWWMQFLLEWLLILSLIAGAVYFLLFPARVPAHSIAASAMFGGIIAVVLFNAIYSVVRTDSDRKRWVYAAVYVLIAASMLVTLVWAIVLHCRHFPGPGQSVFWLEVALLVDFAIFWIVQTRDLWTELNYRRVLSQKAKSAFR